MHHDREYDIVIFGASGFSGKYVVEELAKLTSVNENQSSSENSLKWAIAGRSKTKLEQVLLEINTLMALNTSDNSLLSIPILEADITNYDDLLTISRKAFVLINCVGPFRYHGESVVSACIECGTHYVDICGEPQFLETVEYKFDEKAIDKGVYVIGSCGWDSIPADIGVQLLKKSYEGNLDYVEAFLTWKVGKNGGKINFATWNSAVQGFGAEKELVELRKKMMNDSNKIRVYKKTNSFKLKRKILPFFNEYLDAWCLPFPESARSVVKRTQMYQMANFKEPAVQFETYVTFQSLLTTIAVIILGVFFKIFAMFSFGRTLLEKYPNIFSFGLFTKEGPTREQILDSKLVLTLIGHRFDSPKAIVKIQVNDSGYIATAVCALQSAITIIDEFNNLPKGGGVYTTACAFANTNLVKRLHKHGVKFRVIKMKRN